jgi:FtsZ-interacting cell division protein YlmF
MSASAEARAVFGAKPRKASSLTPGQPKWAWSPVPATRFFKNLQGGVDFHLGRFEAAVTNNAQERVVAYLQTNFPSLASQVSERGVRKLSNSGLAHGARGLKRTIDAFSDLPFWSDGINEIDSLGHTLVSLVNADRLKLNGETCSVCKKKIKATDGAINLEGENHTHFKCWHAMQLRDYLASLRSTLVAISKQARSTRVVLKANEREIKQNKSRFERFLLASNQDYEKFRDDLFAKWMESTDVKEEFFPTYKANFDEYVKSVMRYSVVKEMPSIEIHERLLKHLDKGEAQEITKKLDSPSLRMLRYLGLIEDTREESKSLASYIEQGKALDGDNSSWVERALCAESDPSIFLGEVENSYKLAVSTCNRCPVKTDCLDFALKNGEDKGIWGGTTPAERRDLAIKMSVGLVPPLETQAEKPNITVNRHMSLEVEEERKSGADMYTFELKKYGDIRQIGERYREGFSVIVDMSEAEESERKRAVDFLAGLVFVHNGTIQRISKGVFILLASGASIEGPKITKNENAGSLEHMRQQLLA